MKARKSTVFEFKNYGKISIHLKDILDKQCMTRNELATSIGVKFDVIDRWCNNNTSRIDLELLARMCFVLSCKPEDIIKYTLIEKADTND